ncbi:AraC family transcriptional regulator, partial [Acinetobacter nosocomialis]|nr:AraC family transcriptional regulator [Acinetobacter nosocomialis]
GDYPVFFHYHNFVHDVNECDLVTDIYLLLK